MKSTIDIFGVGRAQNHTIPAPTYQDEDPQSSLHI